MHIFGYIYVYIVNRRFMIWNGNYGWLSPAVSLAWQRLEAFQRCRQRNSCSDKNIGGMTMVFIGRNQRSHRDDKWERGRFLYLKRNGILRSYDISSNICFPAVWVCTFINRWEERVWGGIVNKGKIRREKWLPRYEKFHFVRCINVGLYCDDKIVSID